MYNKKNTEKILDIFCVIKAKVYEAYSSFLRYFTHGRYVRLLSLPHSDEDNSIPSSLHTLVNGRKTCKTSLLPLLQLPDLNTFGIQDNTDS